MNSSWNKGLTKDTDERMRKISESKKGISYSPETQFKSGQHPWNYGLTKETDPRVKKNAEKTTKKLVEWLKTHEHPRGMKGKNPWNLGIPQSDEAKKKNIESNKGSIPWNLGIPHKPESIERMKKSAIGKHDGRKNPMFGKPAPIGSGTGKGKYYNTPLQGTKWLRSSYEIALALFYDKNKILWYYELVRFPVLLNDKHTTYTPDFFLIDKHKFIDTKGWEQWNKDKIQAFKEQYPNIKLDILFRRDLINLGVNIK